MNNNTPHLKSPKNVNRRADNEITKNNEITATKFQCIQKAISNFCEGYLLFKLRTLLPLTFAFCGSTDKLYLNKEDN